MAAQAEATITSRIVALEARTISQQCWLRKAQQKLLALIGTSDMLKRIVLDHRDALGEEGAAGIIKLIEGEQDRQRELCQGLNELDSELFHINGASSSGLVSPWFLDRSFEDPDYLSSSSAFQVGPGDQSKIASPLSGKSILSTKPEPLAPALSATFAILNSILQQNNSLIPISSPEEIPSRSSSLNPESSTPPDIRAAELPVIFHNPMSPVSLSPASSTTSTDTQSESGWPRGSSPEVQTVTREPKVWILNGNWVCGSPELSRAEQYFRNRQHQNGFIAIDLVLRHTPFMSRSLNVTTHKSLRIEINAHLLKACALLACSDASRGLESANTALEIASRFGAFHLESKCQLYRGLCLKDLERWQEASDAFTRAASVRDWSGRLAVLGMECQRMLQREELERVRPNRENSGHERRRRKR